MGKRMAPTQKSKPSDDNSNNSSKAEKTLASATEKNPVKAKTPVKEKKTKATEKKAPTKAEKQENKFKKLGKSPIGLFLKLQILICSLVVAMPMM